MGLAITPITDSPGFAKAVGEHKVELADIFGTMVVAGAAATS